ncbi:glycosyltransferase [Flavobacteriales bacterium 34_180_T64]|nr:glycosyltransferase [Flavobacteriales bacterium 34_180_T64]
MKVLIIQQKMIGDVLTSSILFEALKSEYPNSELHYAINSHTFPVVAYNPFIDQYKFITPEIEKSKLNFYAFLQNIKQEHYDAVIDVYSKFSSNLISKYSKAKTRISKQKWYTNFIYTQTFEEHSKPKTNAGLAIENRLRLLEPLVKSIPKVIHPKVYLRKEELESAKQLLIDSNINLSKPLYMISVLGSSDSKTYPLSQMARLIEEIVNSTDGQILFNYIPKQIEDAQKIFNHCNEATQKHIYFEVFGRGLREFLAITKHCDALIGNEGGAINMAKALDISTFTVFSPWIMKEAWNMFEDGKTHVSIHLKDVKPELYKGKKLKDMKKNVNSLYESFTPETIIPKLNTYLKQK